jgi:hypothetical protein
MGEFCPETPFIPSVHVHQESCFFRQITGLPAADQGGVSKTRSREKARSCESKQGDQTRPEAGRKSQTGSDPQEA